MTYSIQVRGKTYQYDSLRAAEIVAKAIFQQYGIVVGIEAHD